MYGVRPVETVHTIDAAVVMMIRVEDGHSVQLCTTSWRAEPPLSKTEPQEKPCRNCGSSKCRPRSLLPLWSGGRSPSVNSGYAVDSRMPAGCGGISME